MNAANVVLIPQLNECSSDAMNVMNAVNADCTF